MDRDHFSNFLFPHPKEAPYEICAKLAQRLQRRSRLKMLMDGRTDGRTDDGRKVITTAHPEQSSGELISNAPLALDKIGQCLKFKQSGQILKH